jgi:hypothetical protein
MTGHKACAQDLLEHYLSAQTTAKLLLVSSGRLQDSAVLGFQDWGEETCTLALAWKEGQALQ